MALAIIAVANAAVAAAYYLRVVATMYFRSPAKAAKPVASGAAGHTRTPAAALAATIAVSAVIGAGVFPGAAMNAADKAGISANSGTIAAPGSTQLRSTSPSTESNSSRSAD
jgi:NADH:ubiquinone oxidoreductase subunit 2 (subunit N)